ncbi:hypothetical protein [Nocardia sp. NPDC051463]|uniref:hypothetical protein n=1 Tax=Nocardia sp. NPDC051463 TaxID=3154845 RepID=UPI00341268C9
MTYPYGHAGNPQHVYPQVPGYPPQPGYHWVAAGRLPRTRSCSELPGWRVWTPMTDYGRTVDATVNSGAAQYSEPSGALATTAGVLGVVLGACNLIGAGMLLIAFRGDPDKFDNSLAIFASLGAVLLAFALIYGAILLFRRDETGRYTLAVAAGLMTAIAGVALACSLLGYESSYGIHWFDEGARAADAIKSTFGLVGTLTAFVHRDWLAGLTAMVVPLATFLTAASSYTAHWVAAPPRRRAVPHLDEPAY